uniref:WD_REPEATS_REGION domain-containing protein n=1 Tax=Mesocestoides corti TaxID=53468 RepID=A0A5K3F940_MESCO
MLTGNSYHKYQLHRYVPNRQAMDMERAQFVLTQSSLASESAVESNAGESRSGDRILEYMLKRPTIPAHEPLETKANSRQQSLRFIPSKPEKVLDAPELINDYYLNLMDWSIHSDIAVALDREVYLWNALSGNIKLLMSAGLDEEYITSLRFSPQDANILAIGTNFGRIQLWNVNEGSLQRTMLTGDGAPARIPALAWRDHLVTSASRTGEIRQHDIRIARHEVGYCNTHTQEVCGLEWSPDSRYLASGGNDNLVCVFSANEVTKLSGVRPEHMFNDHLAAVKAIAWCPWKPSLLSTGGGTADHHLRFWNVCSGSSVRAVDVETQVSGIIWNQEYRELITSHGNGSLCIWKYPSIQKVKNLAEHQDRVLSIVASPDREMVASCSADETIRIWHCFKVDEAKKRMEEKRLMPIFSLPRPIR